MRETTVLRRALRDSSRVGDPTSQSAAGASPRRSADALDGPACQSEVGGGREHVAVVGPHIAFSDFVRCRKMHCVSGAYEEIAGSGNHERTGPPQQSFVDGNQLPQTVPYVLGECKRQSNPSRHAPPMVMHWKRGRTRAGG